MRSAWAYFRLLSASRRGLRAILRTKLTMPVLSIGETGRTETRSKAGEARRVERGVRHPARYRALVMRAAAGDSGCADPLSKRAAGLTAAASALPRLRLTPGEVRTNQTGRRKSEAPFSPVSARRFVWRPLERRFYTIVLSVPPHTTIRRIRIATIGCHRRLGYLAVWIRRPIR